jgi:hypothetical protein
MNKQITLISVIFSIITLMLVGSIAYAAVLNTSGNTVVVVSTHHNSTTNHTNSTTNTVVATSSHSNTNVTANQSTHLNVEASPKISIQINSSASQALLNYSYTAVNCRTAFIATEVNDSVAAVNGISHLTANLSVLRTQNAHLYTYVGAGNVIGFETYLHGIYDPSEQNLAVSTRVAIRGSANTTNTVRSQLKNEFSSARGVFINCSAGPVVKIADKKLAFYNNAIAQFNAQISFLSSHNVSTANMTTIVAGAQTQIVTPLQTAVSTGNQTQIQAALNQYCMFNGCQNGTNYHLDAKYSIAKLYAIDAKLRALSNNTSDINGSVAALNNASAELGVVGSAQYSNGNGAKIWANIRLAVTDTTNAYTGIKK